MADEADIAQHQEENHRQAALSKRQPYELPKGTPGDCDLCGNWSGRLVDGECAPCRDKYKRR